MIWSQAEESGFLSRSRVPSPDVPPTPSHNSTKPHPLKQAVGRIAHSMAEWYCHPHCGDKEVEAQESGICLSIRPPVHLSIRAFTQRFPDHNLTSSIGRA